MFRNDSVRRYCRGVLCALVCCSALPAFGQSVGGNLVPGKTVDSGLLAQEIASAGRLRMQSQRLAKLYRQVAMGVNPAKGAQQIGQASAEMDAEFARLARYGRLANTQRAYARSEVLWQEMRDLLKKTPASASAERINQVADELMIHAGKLSVQIEAGSETPLGRLVDQSSRLNMLAQRLARLYLLAQAGERSQGVLTDIEQARKEFSTGLRELDTASENSPASRDNIALAKNQWIFFDNALSRLGERNESRALLDVATSSERIAQVLEATSAQYMRDYAAGQYPAK